MKSTAKTAITPYFRRRLATELSRRMESNPRYSMRRFASLLGIAPGPLSEVMNGERSPSDRLVARIFSALEMNEAERALFLQSLLEQKKSAGAQRISRQLKNQVAELAAASRPTEAMPPAELGLDQFRGISDWYPLALWEMVERADFTPKASWIARRLGITGLEAKLAFQRLQDLEMIELVDGRWKKTEIRIQTKDLSKTSEFHRRRQRQLLEKSREALDTVPIEKRHHAGITINIDPSRLPEAKERIQAALWDIARDLEKGQPSQVYEIALQVFPLERIEK